MKSKEEIQVLIQRVTNGDDGALAELFEGYRWRLKRMVTLRLDPRLKARLDASDVIQDAFYEAMRLLPEFGKTQSVPFYLWLRMTVGQRLLQLHRTHLGTAKRTADREVSLQDFRMPEASSVFLADGLVGQFTSAHQNVARDEVRMKLQEALSKMDENDREIIAMRHFEELSTDEIAIVLGLTRSGVLKRHTRAIMRLRDTIGDDSDFCPV